MSTLDLHLPKPALSPVLLGVGAGLTAVSMWASYLTFAKAGIDAGLTPVDFLVLRFAVAGVVMAVWLLLHEPSSLAGVGWSRGTVLALLAGPIFIGVGIGGYVFAPLAHGAVIQPATITLASMVAGAWLLNERLSRDKLQGALLILVGLAIIAATQPLTGGARAWIGDLMFVAAGLLWAAFTILIKRWAVPGMAATAAVSVLSALVVVPGVALFGTFDRILALPASVLATQLIVQGLMSGVLAILAYTAAVRFLGAGRAALFPALVPAATLALGIPVAQEIPTGWQLLGAGLASVGLLTAMGLLHVHRAKHNP